LDGGNSLG